MTNNNRPRLAATIAGLALVVVAISGSESSAKSKQPKPEPTPPPRAISVSTQLIQEAAAYSAYMTRTTAISPGFTDGASVARSLATGVAYEPNAMVRGAMAYGAVVALQDKAFMDAFKSYKSEQQRQEVAFAILRNPYYVTAFPGAASAGATVADVIGGQGRAVYDQGKVIKQSAYDIQHAAWSKGEVADRAGRLAATKTASSAPPMSDSAAVARLQEAMTTTRASTMMSPAPSANTTLVNRSLAVAALAALGHGDDAHFNEISGLMADPGGVTCMKLAKLNLYQCLAVAKPHYEDVFCLGEHVMMDTGRCLMKATGAVVPETPPKMQMSATARPYNPVAKRPTAKKPAAKKLAAK